MSTVLLLITDHPAVMVYAVDLDGDVVRVPNPAAARRWLAEQEHTDEPDQVGMVAWGSDVLRWADGPLTHRLLAGVPQVALRVKDAPGLSTFGLVGVLGERPRIVQFPVGLPSLNEKVWGVQRPQAA